MGLNETVEIIKDRIVEKLSYDLRFRTPYDGLRYQSQVQFLDENGDELSPSPTIQSAKAECDINNVIKKYDKTGLITHVQKSAAAYGDFSEINEYQESLNIVKNAQKSFSEIPAAIRSQFANNPGQFYEFVTDPKNNERLVEMGLATAPIDYTKQPAETAAEAPETASD